MIKSIKELKQEYDKNRYIKNRDKILQQTKIYYKKHKNICIKKTTAYRKLHPEIRRKIHLKKCYKMSVEDYNQLFLLQKGKCAICNIHQSKLNSFLCVDHSHDNQKIRGLLCKKCNTWLGILENKIFCLKASIYLGITRA